MTKPLRVAIEQGPKGKRVVAYAVDWPGWSRAAKTEDAALATLASYRERYRPVADLAGLGAEFDGTDDVDIAERYVGIGSTDFWGISFRWTPAEAEPIGPEDLERKLMLLEACWAYFDAVAATVSLEMRKGPRGGGKDRDEIIAHTFGSERTQMAVKVAVDTPPGVMLTPAGLHSHRAHYLDAIRAYGAEGKSARTWPLAFLIRHTAFHTLDHAWEMEDKDLTGESDA